MAATDFNKLSRELSGSSGILGSLLLFIIIVLIVVLLLWARVTELDNVTRGQGKIVSSLQNQLVQASEGGVIKARFVEEGAKVKVGQILFEIDPIDAKTSYDQAIQRLSSLKIQEIRLAAEILGDEPNFSDDLVLMAPTVVTGERALYAARKADLRAQISVLEQQLIQRRQQIKEVDVTISTAEDTLEFIKKQISIVKPLVEIQQYPETELLSLQRQAKDFDGKIEGAIASKLRFETSILEVVDQISSAKQSYSTKSQSELSAIISQIAEVESRLPALKDRVARTKLKSPVNGVVNRLNFETLGGFVKPGDVILEIVPTGDDLIVEGKIDPKDIAYIQPDQDVRISLTAYDASRYGTIDGKVLKVSPDAVDDKATGMSYYIVDVSIDTTLYEDDGSAIEILPGMVASVDVLAGKRTILDYFWQPMAKVKERAFTD
jgi:adhesin transport system membrane fusion protein